MEAYAIITWGYDEPDVMRCHPGLLPWFYGEAARAQGLPIPSFFQGEDGRVLHFMNATAKPDTRMAQNEVKFENTRHLDNGEPGRYHCKVVFNG